MSLVTNHSLSTYFNSGSAQSAYGPHFHYHVHIHQRPMSSVEQAERLYSNVRSAVAPVAASAAHKAHTAFQTITCHGRAGVEQLKEQAEELYIWLNTPGRDGLTPLQKAGVAAAATTAGVLSLLIVGAAIMLPCKLAKKGIEALMERDSEKKETPGDKYYRLSQERERLVESMRSAKYEYMVKEKTSISLRNQLQSLREQRTQEHTAEIRTKIESLKKRLRSCQTGMDSAMKRQLEIQKKIEPIMNEMMKIRSK